VSGDYVMTLLPYEFHSWGIKLEQQIWYNPFEDKIFLMYGREGVQSPYAGLCGWVFLGKL